MRFPDICPDMCHPVPLYAYSGERVLPPWPGLWRDPGRGQPRPPDCLKERSWGGCQIVSSSWLAKGAVDRWKLLAVDCLKKMSNVICKIPFWLTEGEELGGLVKCCPDFYCLKEGSWVSVKYHPESDWLKERSWRFTKYKKKHPEEDCAKGAHPVVWKALFHRSNFTLFFFVCFFLAKRQMSMKKGRNASEILDLVKTPLPSTQNPTNVEVKKGIKTFGLLRPPPLSVWKNIN